MPENPAVVVFPSAFARKKMPLLIKNIRHILEARGQRFSSIKRDGPVITVRADDPVFASSAIGLLFGISRIAIAKKVENEFETIVSEISEVGSNLLLEGDIFCVQVEGAARGFLPKDLEMAATSSIIEKSKTRARPGSLENHDKLLYTYLTKSSAYVCIFSDRALGGLPYGSHDQTVLCGIFDELSAVSCIETIKQGFFVKIIICYRTETELARTVKMLNRIIPRTLAKRIELEFFRIAGARGHPAFFGAVLDVMENTAKKAGISHVSLPLTPLLFPAGLIDDTFRRFVKKGIIPYAPLGALEDEIYRNASEIGLGKFVSGMGGAYGTDHPADGARATVTSRKISVDIGPNNVHEILDELRERK